MEISVVQRSPGEVSFSDALDYSLVRCFVFRDYPRMWYNAKEPYRFDGDVMGTILRIQNPMARLNALVSRTEAFREVVYQHAYQLWVSLNEPTQRLFLAYGERGECVAIANWAVPEEHAAANLGLVYSLKQSWRRWRARVARWWFEVRSRGYDILDIGDLMERKHNALAHLNCEKTSENETRLSRMHPDQLEKTIYVEGLTYELEYFGVIHQGQGIGKKLFDEAWEAIRKEMRAVHTSQGVELPPKANILASKAGQRLYTSYGFNTISDCHLDLAGNNNNHEVNFSVMSRGV